MKNKQFFKKASCKLEQVSPTILTCIGVIGVAATAVLAVKATPKALKLLDETAYERDEVLRCEELPLLEKVNATWKCYIPATIVGISTIFCIVGINVLNKRNQASLASAYAMLSQSYQKYRKAANTVYGEDADIKINAQIAKERYVHSDGMSIYNPDLDHSGEKILFFDSYSQRYFTTTMSSVLNAQYHLNRNLALRGTVTVNEFYTFLGIEEIEGGDDLGWFLNEMICGGYQWLDFNNHHTDMEDGMQCCVITSTFFPILEPLDD